MRSREELRSTAPRPNSDFAGPGRVSPRLGAVAEAAGKAARIELVAGERIAIASADDSPPWPALDKALLLKVGLGVFVLLALFGALSLAQRFLGL
jgi:hypothetical protein